MALEWVEVAGIELLVASRDPPVVFTSRLGGVSKGPFSSMNIGYLTDDAPALAAENRSILSTALGISRDWCWARQVHGNTAVSSSAGRGVEADALVTAEVDLPLVAVTADCLPIALAASGGIAVVHAGWRGLVGGVIEAAVKALRAVAPPQGAIRAWIGPSIGPCHFEVGEDVASAFLDSYPAAPGLRPAAHGKFSFDLRTAAAWVLSRAGAGPDGEEPPCTFCDPRFFSHRREAPTGRQGVLTWRPGPAPQKKIGE